MNALDIINITAKLNMGKISHERLTQPERCLG